MDRTITAHAPTIALVAGLALTTDVVIITILDRNFGLLDNVLFFLGLGCAVVSLGLLPTIWSRGHRQRALVVAGGTVLLAGGVIGSAALGDWVVASAYSGDNAIATEGAILHIGIYWLLVGLTARVLLPGRTHQDQPAVADDLTTGHRGTVRVKNRP